MLGLRCSAGEFCSVMVWVGVEMKLLACECECEEEAVMR